MRTPNLDYVTGKLSITPCYLKLMGWIAFVLWSADALVECMHGPNVFEHGQRFMNQLDNPWQRCAIPVLWLILAGVMIIEQRRVISSRYVNPNARIVFVKIVDRYCGGKIQYFEEAKLVAERVLTYMTDTEKETIKKLYKETKFDNELQVSIFSATVNSIVDRVFTDNPDMLSKKANRKTRIFNGWNYGTTGHGGR